MRKKIRFLALTAMSMILGSNLMGQGAIELFFSEYAEGSSNHKYIEIFNGTGDSVLLSDYVILISTNGSAWNGASTHKFPAGKYLHNNDVWVIANSQADATSILPYADEKISYSTTTLVVSFNGNDARGLGKLVQKGTTETDTVISGTDTLYVEVIDYIGRYDLVNPGTGWAVAGVANATADHTMVRKPKVLGPNKNWDAAAGTDAASSEWIVYPQNTWTDIGKHTFTPPQSYDKLVINEFLANGSNSDDWIEIYNPNTNNVSLKDWYLSNDSTNKTMWQFPDTSIVSNGYLIVYGNNSGNNYPLKANFEVQEDGGMLLLTNPNVVVSDIIVFNKQKDDTTFGRYPNGTGNFTFTKPTPGAVNELFPKPIPMYTISQINKVDNQGVADSLNVYCKLEGVVFTQNFHATNQQFWMADATGGINVFQYASAGLTYQAKPGDKIRVIGKIAQYRGLLEIMPDSIVLISSNEVQPTPVVVTKLDESTENILVKIMNLTIVDTTSKASSGYNIRATNGTDTFVIRIDDLCEAFDSNFVDTSFNLIGIGGQFNSTSNPPYLDGYQINPRFISDFILHQPNAINEQRKSQLLIYPNPSNGVINIVNPFGGATTSCILTDITGKQIINLTSEQSIIRLTTENMPQGIYMVKLSGSNKETLTSTIFIQ